MVLFLSFTQSVDPIDGGLTNGIALSFVRATIFEGLLICGVAYMKCLRQVSQKMSGSRALKLGKMRIPHRKWFACHLVAADSSIWSSLEPGVKEQYLRVYNTVLDRLPWLKASLNDFIKDGSILDFAVLVCLCATLHLF